MRKSYLVIDAVSFERIGWYATYEKARAAASDYSNSDVYRARTILQRVAEIDVAPAVTVRDLFDD